MKALIDLAQAVQDKEEHQDVSELVKNALEQFKSEREAEASTEIVELVRKVEQNKITQRTEMRRLEAQKKKMVSSLNDLDRRWAFAQQTNNFLPVLAFFNMVTSCELLNPDDFAKLTMVPPDFVMPEKK